MDDDVLVVCQKVVSKAEGRVVALPSIEPSAARPRLGRHPTRTPASSSSCCARARASSAWTAAQPDRRDAERLGLRQRRDRPIRRTRRRATSPCSPSMPTLRQRAFARTAERLGADLAVIVTARSGAPGVTGRSSSRSASPGSTLSSTLRRHRRHERPRARHHRPGGGGRDRRGRGTRHGKADGVGAVLVRGAAVVRVSADGPGARSARAPAREPISSAERAFRTSSP